MLKVMLRSSTLLFFSVGIATLNAAIMARILGVEGRAEFYYLFLPIYFAPAICMQGLAHLSVYLGKKFSTENIKNNTVSITRNSFIFSLLWCCVMYFFTDLLTSINFIFYLVVTFLACVSFALSTYLIMVSCLDEKFFIADFTKIFTPGLNLLCLIPLYYYNIASVELLISSQVVVKLVEITFAYKMLQKVFSRQSIKRVTDVDSESKSYSLRAWKIALNGLVFLHLDKLVIVYLATKEEVGLYAVAVGLSLSANNFVANISQIVISKININLGSAERKLLNISFYYLAAGFIILTMAYFFVGEFIIVVFGAEFSDAEFYTNLLLLKVILFATAELLSKSFVLTGRNHVFLRVQYVYLAIVLIFVFYSYLSNDFNVFLTGLVVGSFVSLLVMYALVIKNIFGKKHLNLEM